MARQLFGTDGIRGVAGQYPLDPQTVTAAGVALGEWVRARHSGHPAILIGIDTRESGAGLAAQLAGGAARAGVRPCFAGLITTPGVAHLAKTGDFAAGVMISASHNPYQDNGVKVFDHSGFKLPDEEELALEQRIFALTDTELEPQPARLDVNPGLAQSYLDFLASTFPHRLDGLRLVLDCANGAATHLARDLFARLGADVIAIGSRPDGRNINLNCGALHTDGLRQAVLDSAAQAGVAFDGDADRAILVSSSGRIINGDAILLILAGKLLSDSRLADRNGQPAVVATVMSNFGLEVALKDKGIRLLRTAVGDKYVLEEMLRCGIPLGGEQSGHVILTDYATTGDGMLTALRVLEVMKQSGQPLDSLAAGLQVFPQLLVNVRVKKKRPLEELASVQNEIGAAMAEFNGAGRVVVRFSGTEPLARVMVEGPVPERVEHYAYSIARSIEAELSA